MRKLVVWRKTILALALLLVCGIAVQLWREVESANAATRTVEHTHQVLNTAELLLSTVKDAETGQRGYLLTGDREYLAPYRAALATEQPLRARLASLVADNPAQIARVREIDRAVRQRLEFLARTIPIGPKADRAAALAVVRTGEGNRLMDNLRIVVHRAEEAEQQLLLQRAALAGRRSAELQWTILIGLGALIFLLAVMGVSAERYLVAHERAEGALRVSEERVRRVLDNLPDVVVLYDRDRRIQYINSPTTAITGLTPAQFIGKREEDIWPPEVCAQIVTFLDAARDTKQPQTKEIDLDLAETGLRHLLVRAVPVLDGAGDVRELVGITHDLTDWKRSQEALLLQSEREVHVLEAMVAAAPVALLMLDRNLRQVQVSQRWLDDVGLTREQVIGKHHYDCYPILPEDWKVAYRRGLAGEALGLSDVSYTAPEGTLHWVNWEIRPWGDAGQTTGGIIIYAEDITEQKRTDRAARESELQYRALFEHMSEGLAYCEMIFEDGEPRDFAYRAVNEAFETLTGLRNAVGKRVSELVPGILEADPELIRSYGRVASTGIPVKFEVWVEALQMWFSISAYSPEKDFFVAVFDVITERKRAEEALRESEAVLRGLFDSPDVMRGIVEIIDGAIVHISCNRAAAKMYGLDRESISGKSATAAGVGDEIAQTWVGLYEKSRSSGEPVSMEYARRDADGQERWLLATASYMGNGHSGNPRFGYTIFDLTEQKRAEEKLRQSEEQYRTLFDALREGFCIIEVIFEADVPVDFRFLEINPAFEKQTGLVNVRGRLMRELAPDHESHWNEIYGQVTLTGQPVRFVSESNLLNRWYDVSAYRIGGPGSRKVAVLFNDITEARRAEEAVRENRAMLHAALASMADAVFISDAGGRFIEINDAFATFHRFKNTEECAKTFAEYPDLLDVYLPDGTIAPVDRWAVPRALRGEVATNAEYTMRRKDSGETWVGSYSFGPIRDKDGAIAGSVVVGRDITERKRAELAAREWSRAFEQAEIGIALVKPGVETFSAVNATFARERGYLPEELIGQPIALVNPPERLEWLKKTVERANSGPGHAAVKSVHVRKDGSRFPVFIDLTGVRDEDGRLVSRVIISQDLTERNRAEQERQRSEALYQAIVRNLPGTGLFVVDTDMRYIAVEGDLPLRLGFPREALLGRAVSDVLETSNAIVSGERFRRTLEGGTPSAEGEFQGCAVWTRFAPLRDGSGGVFAALALSTDITERKLAEEQIRQLNEDLEGRVRRRTAQLETANQELEAFSYSVSHDLRAPLRGIDGWSMALIEDYGQSLDETARRYLGRVRSETQRMGLLIDDMLQLSRVTRSEMRIEDVDLSALAQRVADRLQEENPGRRIEFRIEDGLRVRGDMRLLEVALTNLLGNAVKFTAPRAEARIEFGLTEAAGEPAYFVRDNGVGFNMAYASTLFGAFQRLHKVSEFPGSGIGLATVQRVVRHHGGRAWAEAVAGEGATFYFTLGAEK